MTHEQRVQAAVDAIRAVHGDTSVSPSETRDALITLRDEVAMNLDAVETDLQGEEG